ncbi:3-dehydroquinate synthase [Dirofilaria immitis]
MKLSNNRSVMPLDVQGCTRATLEESACYNHYRKILWLEPGKSRNKVSVGEPAEGSLSSFNKTTNTSSSSRIEHKDFECTLHHRVDSRWYVWLRSIEGARPVRVKKVTICYTLESGCLRLQPKEGGKPHLRLNMTTRPIANKAEVERICWDPKDGELYLSRMKPEETLVEVRSDSDVQIDRLTLKTWPQRVRGSQWLALKTLGVGPVGASIGADLGGSSKYSSEILED